MFVLFKVQSSLYPKLTFTRCRKGIENGTCLRVAMLLAVSADIPGLNAPSSLTAKQENGFCEFHYHSNRNTTMCC